MEMEGGRPVAVVAVRLAALAAPRLLVQATAATPAAAAAATGGLQRRAVAQQRGGLRGALAAAVRRRQRPPLVAAEPARPCNFRTLTVTFLGKCSREQMVYHFLRNERCNSCSFS